MSPSSNNNPAANPPRKLFPAPDILSQFAPGSVEDYTCNIDDLILVFARPECWDPTRWLVFKSDASSHASTPDNDTTLSISANTRFQKLMSGFFYQCFGGRKWEGEKTEGLFSIRATRKAVVTSILDKLKVAP